MANTNGRFLLGILIGLICGGSLAYLLVDSQASSGSQLEVRQSAADTRTLTPSVGALSAPRTGDAQREVAVMQAGATISDTRVQELASRVALPRMEPTTGSGSISGRVTDVDGAGISDVLVIIDPLDRSPRGVRADTIGAGEPEAEDLEAVVRETAERLEVRRANRRETRSDASGTYRFEGLPIANWSLKAFATGYVVTTKARSYRVLTDSVVDLTAMRVVQVPIAVIETGGMIPTTALIECTAKAERAQPKRFEWSSDVDFVRLTPGDYTIQAHSIEVSTSGEAVRSSLPQDVQVTDVNAADLLTLELRSRVGVEGRVRFADDDLTTDRVYVALVGVAPDQAYDQELLKRSGQRKSVRPEESYSFTDLEAGRYIIGVARDIGGSIVAYRDIEVSTKMEVCDLELPSVDLARSLTVTVHDESGATVNGLSLRVRSDQTRTYAMGMLSTPRTPTGEYIVEFDEAIAKTYFGTDAGDAKFTLHASHRQLGNREYELQRGQTELTIVWTAPGTLTITVPGYQGSGFEGRLSVECVLQDGSDEFYSPNWAAVSPQGTAEVIGLQAGNYRVTLRLFATSAHQSFSDTRLLDVADVDVVAGANQVQLRIPPLYSLEVHWADGKEGTRLSLEAPEGGRVVFSMPSASLDARGHATFENIPAGHYALVAGFGRSAQRMQVTIPSEAIEFTPIEIQCLRVVITDPTGDYAKIGLKSGDRIIGVDGEEFVDTPSMAIFEVLNTSKSARLNLLVDRAGSRVELSVQGTDLGDWRVRGGDLIPDQR